MKGGVQRWELRAPLTPPTPPTHTATTESARAHQTLVVSVYQVGGTGNAAMEAVTKQVSSTQVCLSLFVNNDGLLVSKPAYVFNYRHAGRE